MKRLSRLVLFLLVGFFASSCAVIYVEEDIVRYTRSERIYALFYTIFNDPKMTIKVSHGTLSLDPHPLIRSITVSDDGKQLDVAFFAAVGSQRGAVYNFSGALSTLRYTSVDLVSEDVIRITAGVWPMLETEIAHMYILYIVNKPPVNSVPSAQSVEAGQTLALNFGVSDPDIGVGFYDITFSVAEGRLTPPNGFTPIGAGDIVQQRGNGVYIKTTAANVARYLQGMTYSAPNAATTDTITMFTNDRGNNGDDGQKTDTDTVSITVLAPPPPVVFEAPPPAGQSAPSTPLTLVGDTVTCADNATCSGAITAVGGVPPYSFNQTDDNNAGFTSLNGNGSYSFFINAGTYTDSPFRWGIQVTDSAGTTVSKTYTLVVPNPAP